MKRLVSKNILYLTIIIFLAVILIEIITTLWQNRQEQTKITLEYSRVLSDYAMTNRIYYQNLYLKGIIPLTKNTLKGLPAFSSSIISKKFSDINKDHIKIKTVSDNPRNPKNKADPYELSAIKTFKSNPSKKEYFKEYKNFYQYAIPLKIKAPCLKCHGKIENAPSFIQKNYKNAYGYKIGDIRGVLSIKIPKFHLQAYFTRIAWSETVKNIILFSVLLILVLYISLKNRKFNAILESMVDKKTKELQQREQQMLYISQHDELTGLPNRMYLKKDLKFYNIGKIAYINIDDFKDINDFYGIKTGDIVLKEYALFLKNIAKNHGINVYKLPSDEFALFSHEDIDNSTFLNNIKEILNTLNNKVFTVNSHEIILSSTVGISFEKDHIMSKTDIALKKAKKENTELVIYSKDDNIELNIQHNFNMIKKIKEAIKNDKIVPFFQPILNIKTKTVTKYESLARLIEKDGSIISPYSFLEIAKKARLYPYITENIIKKTFDTALKYPDISFSINLSSFDMQDKKTIDFIKKSFERLKNHDKIVFEILESESIKNYEKISKFITDFKNTGCKFAIDDFGSGYSNFAHLIELNIDFLKIDASLIKNIHTDKKSFETVKAIVNFAKTMGVKTIAEYVESEEILNKVIHLDIDFAQGYHIGKPQEKFNQYFNAN